MNVSDHLITHSFYSLPLAKYVKNFIEKAKNFLFEYCVQFIHFVVNGKSDTKNANNEFYVYRKSK